MEGQRSCIMRRRVARKT
uniref:Uncharacterized protein n=1 Tax=Pseudomonas aeruginosa TaxID=287 RepID=Q9APT9_PSEAI|nr:hypothetical protein [Pseudomonas aeruginosa]